MDVVVVMEVMAMTMVFGLTISAHQVTFAKRVQYHVLSFYVCM
jgi:copper(I)-binding protein